MPIIPLAGNFMGMITSKSVQNGPYILGGFNSDFKAIWITK
jgi:hypothetical protein